MKIEKLYSLMVDENGKYSLLEHNESTNDYEPLVVEVDLFTLARTLNDDNYDLYTDHQVCTCKT